MMIMGLWDSEIMLCMGRIFGHLAQPVIFLTGFCKLSCVDVGL